MQIALSACSVKPLWIASRSGVETGAKCETVEALRREGWEVLAKCELCGLLLRVDLALVIRVASPRTSLWNRKARGRRVGCLGRVEFQARAPGMAWHEALLANDREVL